MYTLREIKPNIFLADFTNEYDLAMTFCRYQEFYESDNKAFYGQAFKLLDFMEWYAKKHDNVFTYTRDWSGFNLPVAIIDDLNSLGIKDRNKYDTVMSKIVSKIKHRPAYLIGTCGIDALEHEVAHGLFYTDIKYRKEMTKLVKGLDKKIQNTVFNYLTALGYAKHVHIDECQAYLATGLSLPGKEHILKAAKTQFIATFAKYEAGNDTKK